MTGIIKVVSDSLLTMLAPLVGEGDGKLRQVEQLPIVNAGNEQALADILERSRSRMPGGILSVPEVQFANNEGGPRITDLDMGFAFVAGYNSRGDFTERQAFHFARFDEIAQYLRFDRVSRRGISTSNLLDFIRLNAWSYGESQDVSAQILTFTVRVRNWTPNELES